jgi:capsid assembly protease
MSLLDILTAPWAIQPEKLLEMQAVYATHLRGDKIDLDAVEARLGRPLANEQKAYRLVEGTGVAVLEVAGVIAPKATMFTRISGGTAASALAAQVTSMMNDPKVKSVVLDIDSPGGNVLGIPALGEAVRALAAAKPTVTVCTGTLCSAAYWVGSAANAVYLSGTTDNAGSIGVVATHAYDPRRSEVQVTEVTAGKYKRMASGNAPLSADGRAYMQGQVDELYRVFVETVAANRQASVEEVLTHMADGRVFIGQQAIDAGLAEGIATVDAMVERLHANPQEFSTRGRARFAATASRPFSADSAGTPSAEAIANAAGDAALAPPPEAEPVCPEPQATNATPIQGASPMTPQEQAAAFAAQHPEAAAHLSAQAATAERTRIQAVREQLLPGHQALIDALAFDGKTTGPEAAVQVLAAERARTGHMAASRAADAPAPVLQAAPESDPAPAAAAAAAPAYDPVAAAALARQAQTIVAQAKAEGRTVSVSQAVAMAKAAQTA